MPYWVMEKKKGNKKWVYKGGQHREGHKSPESALRNEVPYKNKNYDYKAVRRSSKPY